ncbi:MAG: response regulator [Christensenella sp.]|nr:response regulator [Christensenella sp.]
MYRIFIADDEDTIRGGIRDILESEKELYSVCGEASDGELALPMIQEMKPDILITDICMPFIDGLKLSSMVKKAMPWIHILILSGYDEFSYAQKAIEIGVDGYVLKPILAEGLKDNLKKIRVQIEEERKKILEALSRRKKEEKNRNSLLDFYFNELVNGTIDSCEAYKRSEELGIDIVAQDYVLCYITVSKKMDMEELQAFFGNLLENKKEAFGFRYSDDYILLVKGSSSEKTMESACEIVQLLKHESERILNVELSANIGAAVERISDIAKSFQKIKKSVVEADDSPEGHLIKVLAEQDKKTLAIDFSESGSLTEKLRHAEISDVDKLVDCQFNVTQAEEKDSVLYRYYLLVDLIVVSVRLLKELGAEQESIALQEKANNTKLLECVISYDATCEYAKDFLMEVIRYREQQMQLPYSEEMKIAKQYIKDHYCDEGLSLHTVAQEVGFSPNHFSTVFSQQMGVTFIEYLIRYRIEKSKQLLCETDLNLNDITFQIGYSEPHYFSYVFKKYTKMTPGAYRKAYRNKNDGNNTHVK